MKKVLLATTALTLSAGFASADVSFPVVQRLVFIAPQAPTTCLTLALI